MNENIDLTKILKDCPIGWMLYSSVHGYVAFQGIENGSTTWGTNATNKHGKSYEAFLRLLDLQSCNTRQDTDSV